MERALPLFFVGWMALAPPRSGLTFYIQALATGRALLAMVVFIGWRRCSIESG